MYILKIPDDEELIIPEYIDGKKVVELGHGENGLAEHEFVINGTNTKKLTIQHQFSIRDKFPAKYYVNFPNLTDLIFIDFLYCNLSCTENDLTVPYYIWKSQLRYPKREVKKIRARI